MGTAALALALLPPGGAASADEGGGQLWTSAGGNTSNTRYQQSERTISPGNVGRLATKWAFTTEGDVSATPAVDASSVYVPDWAGNLYSLDRKSGALHWSVKISAASGVPGDRARATPAVSDDTLVIGTQGPFGGGGKVIAYDKQTGAARWTTTVDTHPAAIITQSATIYGGTVYVGTSSLEEAYAGFIPGYDCCSFRGSMTALDLATGAILWRTYMVPDGYSGGAVWGSSPAVDATRGQLYIATGNNYSVPDEAQACVAAGGSGTACLSAADHFDSVVALDMATGAFRWVTRALPFDTWVVNCIGFGDPTLCPEPAGPDYDFGQAPALFTAKAPNGKKVELLGVGQKSGQYWALDPSTGAVRWTTQAGPGGTGGGLQWGSAVDGRRIYTANANSDLKAWAMPDGTTVNAGVWSALDPSTGALLWQQVAPHGGSTSGPVTTANGVVFGCSLDPYGYMYALDAATGRVLWEFASGGSCLSGAAISRGMVYWGSGYSNLGFGTPNNKVYAFGLS